MPEFTPDDVQPPRSDSTVSNSLVPEDFEQLRPDHENPWAMQLAVHRDRGNEANHLDVCQAAGRAVVTLLDDSRARDADGEWSAAVSYWRAGWIRKVVRRADGKRWDDAQALPGVTVASGADADDRDEGVLVRAFVPGPLAPLPRQLKKLQVGGTEFPRYHASTNAAALVTVHISPLVELTTGKAAAQVGHASQLAYEAMDETARGAWRASGFLVRAAVPTRAQWAASAATGAHGAALSHSVSVVDAGLTELDGPTETTRAFWG